MAAGPRNDSEAGGRESSWWVPGKAFPITRITIFPKTLYERHFIPLTCSPWIQDTLPNTALCWGRDSKDVSSVALCSGSSLSFPLVMGFTADVTNNFLKSSWLFLPLFLISVTSQVLYPDGQAQMIHPKPADFRNPGPGRHRLITQVYLSHTAWTGEESVGQHGQENMLLEITLTLRHLNFRIVESSLLRFVLDFLGSLTSPTRYIQTNLLHCFDCKRHRILSDDNTGYSRMASHGKSSGLDARRHIPVLTLPLTCCITLDEPLSLLNISSPFQ